MARRWVRWTGGGLLVVLLLLGWGVSLEITERLAGLERSLLEAAPAPSFRSGTNA